MESRLPYVYVICIGSIGARSIDEHGKNYFFHNFYREFPNKLIECGKIYLCDALGFMIGEALDPPSHMVELQSDLQAISWEQEVALKSYNAHYWNLIDEFKKKVS